MRNWQILASIKLCSSTGRVNIYIYYALQLCTYICMKFKELIFTRCGFYISHYICSIEHVLCMTYKSIKGVKVQTINTVCHE